MAKRASKMDLDNDVLMFKIRTLFFMFKHHMIADVFFIYLNKKEVFMNVL